MADGEAIGRDYELGEIGYDVTVGQGPREYRRSENPRPELPEIEYQLPDGCHELDEVGYTVDVDLLLFPPGKDYIAHRNGKKVTAADLKGKTIVLFICPLIDMYMNHGGGVGDALDMAEAYNQLLGIHADVEFVLVPVQHLGPADEKWFDYLHDLLPFPAVSFLDVDTIGRHIKKTFSVGSYDTLDGCVYTSPYWVLIDPRQTVVATRYTSDNIFKLFNGNELYPLNRDTIDNLLKDYRSETSVQRARKWTELMTSPYLRSSDGGMVHTSTLEGRLVGLYFCENVPHPPRMRAIKEVYEEAKSNGCDFEIVQITFHYHCSHATYRGTADMLKKNCSEDVPWLTLPFKDPSCRKLQRIFKWTDWLEELWVGDCLVLVHPDQLPEFSGAEIIEQWGMKGYPFKWSDLVETEYQMQKKELTVGLLFPPGKVFFRHQSGVLEHVRADEQLSGKRVLVVFSTQTVGTNGASLISKLKSKYDASKFEVVYVSVSSRGPLFYKFTEDMPWLLCSYDPTSNFGLLDKVFKAGQPPACAAAFNEDGELIAKEHNLNEQFVLGEEFPFIDEDLPSYISMEVGLLIGMDRIYETPEL